MNPTVMLAFLTFAAIALLGIANGISRGRAHELRVLAEMSRALQLSTTFDEAVEVVPDYARRLFPGFDGAIASAGPADSTLCVPLRVREETVGVFTLRARPRTRIDRDLVRRASAFAEPVALALSNLRLQETLRMRAVSDALTGLFNRRWMEETLLRELLRATRAETRVGVILADVDHFKQYNDRWGHAGGDAALQQLARLMQSLFRAEDVVCRLGGEEFVIVLPDTSFDRLRAAAERLVEESRRLDVHLHGQLLGAITLSAGIAISSAHASTVDELLSAADRALYAAKSAGRDRVATPPHHVVAA